MKTTWSEVWFLLVGLCTMFIICSSYLFYARGFPCNQEKKSALLHIFFIQYSEHYNIVKLGHPSTKRKGKGKRNGVAWLKYADN